VADGYPGAPLSSRVVPAALADRLAPWQKRQSHWLVAGTRMTITPRYEMSQPLAAQAGQCR
jgi:hypothetical protein